MSRMEPSRGLRGGHLALIARQKQPARCVRFTSAMTNGRRGVGRLVARGRRPDRKTPISAGANRPESTGFQVRLPLNGPVARCRSFGIACQLTPRDNRVANTWFAALGGSPQIRGAAFPKCEARIGPPLIACTSYERPL